MRTNKLYQILNPKQYHNINPQKSEQAPESNEQIIICITEMRNT